jgi:hypothetical protein
MEATRFSSMTVVSRAGESRGTACSASTRSRIFEGTTDIGNLLDRRV